AGGEFHGCSRNVLAGTAGDRGFHQRMQHRLRAAEVFGEERAGKFHREKLMPLVRGAPGHQRFVVAMIKPGRARREVGPAAAAFHEPMTVEVEAKLDATRMKTRRPVQLALGLEIMPLDAEAESAETPEQGL